MADRLAGIDDEEQREVATPLLYAEVKLYASAAAVVFALTRHDPGAGTVAR